jgi:hypothetical protein
MGGLGGSTPGVNMRGFAASCFISLNAIRA